MENGISKQQCEQLLQKTHFEFINFYLKTRKGDWQILLRSKTEFSSLQLHGELLMKVTISCIFGGEGPHAEPGVRAVFGRRLWMGESIHSSDNHPRQCDHVVTIPSNDCNLQIDYRYSKQAIVKENNRHPLRFKTDSLCGLGFLDHAVILIYLKGKSAHSLTGSLIAKSLEPLNGSRLNLVYSFL